MSSELSLVVNTIGIVLFLGTIVGIFAEKYRLPKMVPLILTGIILSFLRPEILIDFGNESNKEVALIIAELGLLLVLYQEGMHISLRQLRENILPIAILAVIGTIFTATIVSMTITEFSSLIPGIDQQYLLLGSLLMASVVVPTDPAATFSILKNSGNQVKKHLETILGGESAFNDVIAIMLVIVILLPQVESQNTSLVITPIFFVDCHLAVSWRHCTRYCNKCHFTIYDQ